MLYVCVGGVRCCPFCLNCEPRSFRCSCIGSMSILSCICCMFVSYMHPVAVLIEFLMNCKLLMLVEDEDARGDHMEEAYSRACLMTAL